tara:strand:+ start:185 stop:532 length:348 start_codon:yes stop_codon:yes gene_type:complete
MKKKIKVFYDGNCKVCDREISYYKKNDSNKKFEWVNIHNSRSEINRLNIQKKELMDVLHIETESGKILKGVDAFLEIWSNFKYFRSLAFIVKIKPIKRLTEIFYKIWAKKRKKKY